MGRAAGAVLTAVAPEAKLAAGAAGAGRRRRPAPADPRATAPGSTAARQREQIEQLKANRAPEPQTPAPAPATSPPPASPGGGPSLPAITLPPVAQTGSGFLLGVFAWACGLAYLRGGSPEVRKFLAAKFLNKTGG